MRMLLVIIVGFAAWPAAPLAAFAPPEGRILIVVGQDVKNINAYVRKTGHIPAGFSVYTSAEFADGLQTRADHGAGVQHAQAIVDRYPGTVLLIGLHLVHSLERLNDGLLDDSLDRLADWIAEADRPVYLRIGYEFDLPENDYDPGAYKTAFRRIVERMRARDVRNVAFVWHSHAGFAKRPHEDWYPGDAYVDWVGVSYFRQPERYIDAVAELAARLNKPLMVAEASPWHVPAVRGDEAWRKWFEPFFAFVERHGVKMVSYINCDWDAFPLFASQRWGDTRVQSNRTVKDRWLRTVDAPPFLSHGPGLFETLGFEALAPPAPPANSGGVRRFRPGGRE